MRRVQTESRHLAFAGLLLIALFSVAACSTPVPDQVPGATGVTVFEGARLIVGNESAPIENSVFVVDDGKFTQVGIVGDLAPPTGAQRVDLSGKTVMPALVNCRINGNLATATGGAVFSQSGLLSLTNCTITNNTANNDGGGIYCTSNSSPTITGCAISYNTTVGTASNGGGISCGFEED